MPRNHTLENKIFVVREMAESREMSFLAFLFGLGKAYGQS